MAPPVTLSAGYLKIFSPDPKLGFLSHATTLADKLAATGAVMPSVQPRQAQPGSCSFTDYLDTSTGISLLFWS